jgi:hypothetical protein
LPDLADAELAQLSAAAALLPVEQRAAFVQRVAAARWHRGDCGLATPRRASLNSCHGKKQWTNLGTPHGRAVVGSGGSLRIVTTREKQDQVVAV